MRPPRTSVVVTNHDYAAYLPAALDSALGQSLPPHEVIVVDDGSTDETRAVLMGYPMVDAVFRPAGGQTSAMNAGFARSTGEVVVFLDADDVLEPAVLEQVAAAFAEPGTSVVHWRLAEVDASGAALGRVRPSGGLPSGDLSGQVIQRGPATYEPPPTSGNAWARSFLSAVMPLPEVERELGVGSAHADVFLADLAALFGDVRVLPSPGGRYRVHGSNDFASHSEQRRFERDRWLFGERCRRLAAFLAGRGLTPDVDAWERGSWVHRVTRAYADIDAALGHDSRFVLVDDAQLPAILEPGRAVPFTCVDGVYHGPPVDGAAAVAELVARRAEGVAGVAVAWTAFWWLEQYAEMARHLAEHWTPAAATEHVLVFSR